MKRVHTFSKTFCDGLIASINDKDRIILQYGYENVNNEENYRVVSQQPINSDVWKIDYENEYIIEVLKILNEQIENLYKHRTYIQRFNSEKKCKPHRDTSNYTSILLLNDEFIGGDLIINNNNSNLKLGELIIFDSNEIHYIDKVIDGQRYTLVSFINVRDKKQKSLI